jgi:DNA-binding NtrC family response regulator
MASARMHPGHPVLLVDDEAQALDSFSIALEFLGINNIVRCQDERAVMDILASTDVEIVVMDMIMPHIAGDKLLGEISLRHPCVPVIMATGVDDVSSVVRCMRQGAFDYLVKPVDTNQLANTVRRALDYRSLGRKNDLLVHHILTGSLKNPEAFAAIVTRDAKTRSLFKYCEAVACGGEPVLITGETGVGKELFAKALHAASRRPGEFVAVNAAGLDDHVFADTLFGHKKGAFTGAVEARKGMLERAASGTIFLDEIGDLSEMSQIKLLRVLQDRQYYPLGSDSPRPVEARFVVATNKGIEALAAGSGFRQDLYYRLRTHHVHVPPLRDRQGDIPILLEHFLLQAAAEFAKPKPAHPRELAVLLATYHFPGNIRELRAMVFDAVGRHGSRMLSMESFREQIKEPGGASGPAHAPDAGVFSGLAELPTLKEAVDALVDEALTRSQGNQRIAASMLGISPPALCKRLKNSGVADKRPNGE